ncbi:xylulokinase [Microbacterium paludicola]|uniref:Xylulose kinase n=1 Tax=Microbacterium paludicola TaxID=300019 RepID=A0A4Y9FYV9_9MICO|nr:xylulokinase [Microbacterium paludicola]TFU33439.1 xylulokinase [Microbacterium paludicola]
MLSHDLGTTGDKATLVDDAGRVVDTTTATYSVTFGPGGLAEQDPDDWWRAVCVASRQLIDAHPEARGALAAVAFSGQMMGAVMLDGDLAPVRPAIIWADTRSSAQADRLVERVGMARAYRITGHRLNPTYTLPKLMLVRDREPDVFARVRHVVLAKDYVVLRLTGELATDPSDASGTNAFDQTSGDWSDELLAAAEVPRGVLPPIVPSTTIIGHVTGEAASLTGIAAGTPVVIGGGDGPMAALGAGVHAPSSGTYGYLGTSSWVSYASTAPLHDPQMRSMTFNHVVPGLFVPTATMQSGGGAIEWIADVLEPQSGGERYAALLGPARSAAAADDGLFFLPHLLGERSPYWNPHARAAFVGLGRHHDRPHLVRAVLEGVAFTLMSGLHAFREGGAAITGVDLIGGAANSEVVMSVLCDVWGVPVRRRALVDESTALGAAVVGGVGVGVFSDFGISRRMSELDEPLQPDHTATAKYREAHEAFTDAYRRLEPWFEDRAAAAAVAREGDR